MYKHTYSEIVNFAPVLLRVLYMKKKLEILESTFNVRVNSAINPCPNNGTNIATNIAVRYQDGYSLETKIANLNQFGGSFQQITE